VAGCFGAAGGGARLRRLRCRPRRAHPAGTGARPVLPPLAARHGSALVPLAGIPIAVVQSCTTFAGLCCRRSCARQAGLDRSPPRRRELPCWGEACCRAMGRFGFPRRRDSMRNRSCSGRAGESAGSEPLVDACGLSSRTRSGARGRSLPVAPCVAVSFAAQGNEFRGGGAEVRWSARRRLAAGFALASAQLHRGLRSFAPLAPPARSSQEVRGPQKERLRSIVS